MYDIARLCVRVCRGLIVIIALSSSLGFAQSATPDREALIKFLLKAKLSTYASQGDEATVKNPLLPGTHQLEYSEGPLLYRDIYTGNATFAGQEIVYYNGKPVWTMSYAGIIPKSVAAKDVDGVVKLLHKALMQVPADIPYRGPRSLQDGDLKYANSVEGTLDSFFGRETIGPEGAVFYELRYGGGLVR